MVRIFEKQQQLNKIPNYQSRIIQYDSFQKYLDELDERSLPQKDREIHLKHVDYINEIVTFMFEVKHSGRWIEYIHFAQVIK
jgi:hypothetical protein